jgi:hypothetical protein
MDNTNLKFGLAISALLALTDVAGLAGTGSDDAPPFLVIAASAVLGLITFGALRSAWRRVPAALWTVVATRVLSGLASLPPFFVDAPTWVRIACAVTVALTVLGVGLVLPYARSTRARAVRPA